MVKVGADCKSILIVEDEESIRQTMRDILEIKGFKVFSAANGAEGIDQLKSMPEKPCVVLLDMMMPVKNGWQFLDIQRNDPQFSDIPVIICSAYEESAKAVRPDDFVSKPVQLSALMNAVNKFCH